MLRNDVLNIVEVINELIRFVLVQLLLKYFVLEVFLNPTRQDTPKLNPQFLLPLRKDIDQMQQFIADLMVHLQLLARLPYEFLDGPVEVPAFLLGAADFLAQGNDFANEVGQFAVYQESDAAFEFADCSALSLCSFATL